MSTPSGGTDVVITGVGMVTPLGLDTEATWAGVTAGDCAIGRITRFDPTGFPVTIGAEAPDPGADVADRVPEGVRHLVADLKGRLAAVALLEALEQAGWSSPSARGEDPARVGVCMGSEAARPSLGELHERMLSGEPPTEHELARMAPNAPTVLAAAMAGATGPQSTISTACTSSSQAVGEGLLRLRRGEVDAMIVGGVDVLVDPVMVTGFSKLGALSTRNDEPQAASRPFDRDRDGFVLGEGAGMLVIETAEHAAARGATVLGRILGFGCSANAYRITDSPPDGRGAWQAMEAALLDAGLGPGDIDYINAHGTSTQMNDSSETAGIHRAFGEHVHSVPVSSTKSLMGHLVAACGAVEAILCMLAVRDGVVPPTGNLDHVDPSCQLDHVPHHARKASVRRALTNAFGFGGSNGSLIIGGAE